MRHRQEHVSVSRSGFRNRQESGMNATRDLDITGDLGAAPITKTPFATAVDHAWAPIAHTFLGRVAVAMGDLLAAVGVVLCVPIVILAIGIPIALCVRVLLWIAGFR